MHVLPILFFSETNLDCVLQDSTATTAGPASRTRSRRRQQLDEQFPSQITGKRPRSKSSQEGTILKIEEEEEGGENEEEDTTPKSSPAKRRKVCFVLLLSSKVDPLCGCRLVMIQKQSEDIR